MTKDKEWSLKGKLYYPTYKHEGELHYKEDDIITLREKLIEDITPERIHEWYLEACVNLKDESYNTEAQKAYDELTDEQKFIDKYIVNIIKKKINRRFGVDD